MIIIVKILERTTNKRETKNPNVKKTNHSYTEYNNEPDRNNNETGKDIGTIAA